MKRCLFCYQLLTANEKDFHSSCSKKMFGLPQSPDLPYTEMQMKDLAIQVIQSQMTVTGVQPKLSLEISKGEQTNDPKRFKIVSLWGRKCSNNLF